MFKKVKKSLSLVLIAAMVFSFNLVAFAQGTTSLTVSNAQIGVGDSTTVSVAASSSGTVTVKYTASLLEVTDCTASDYSSDGNAISFSGTAGDIVFKAIGEGTASVIVSSTACSGSSTTITVSGQGTGETVDASVETTSETEGEAIVETSSALGSLNDEGGFDINGVAYVVSERYSEGEIPAGFSKVTLSIGGGTYNELSNGSITLVYLKPADNTQGSGVFYSYDEAAGTVSSFDMVKASNDTIVLAAPDSIPAALFETVASFGEASYTVYTFDGSEGAYLYGTNAAGVTGWFFYDANGALYRTETALLSRSATVEQVVDVVDDTATQDDGNTYDSTAVYKDKLKKLRRIISVLVILCVILLFVVINTLVRGRNGDEVDPDDIFAKTPSKPQTRLPRSIVFANPDDDEEDDEDEEDDDEEPSKPKKSGIDMMDLNDL